MQTGEMVCIQTSTVQTTLVMFACKDIQNDRNRNTVHPVYLTAYLVKYALNIN